MRLSLFYCRLAFVFGIFFWLTQFSFVLALENNVETQLKHAPISSDYLHDGRFIPENDRVEKKIELEPEFIESGVGSKQDENKKSFKLKLPNFQQVFVFASALALFFIYRMQGKKKRK